MTRFAHDGCPSCRFIGMVDDEDIWACCDTLMRRTSSEPSDYQSMPVAVVGTLPDTDEASRWRAAKTMVEQSDAMGEMIRDGITAQAMDMFAAKFGFVRRGKIPVGPEYEKLFRKVLGGA